ncbi:hypothetical protein BDDG_13221 [Blastomyces dermatitidis ATCC 18188]|uniref:Uncharacterized protein n=1 Tax=Ajellomyces dermatitidis (strain ATCC 18188 / CBS 674.68) TaxID=653446 RepID=A0A0J9HIM8_AJEDA|nr:hypothetical protein BDDG_13221 [Blastomyces dermatitidis ATCC 18188]
MRLTQSGGRSCASLRDIFDVYSTKVADRRPAQLSSYLGLFSLTINIIDKDNSMEPRDVDMICLLAFWNTSSAWGQPAIFFCLGFLWARN